MLHSASTECARRLNEEYIGTKGSDDPIGRARMRDVFLDAARVVHAEGGLPRLEALRFPSVLEPEERRVLDHAAGWYAQLYGNRAVTTHLHDCDRPTESPRLGVRVGGWVDLTMIGDDGTKELRQLELWDGRQPSGSDPLELERVWMAVLRLARWVGDDPLQVSWADLVRGDQRQRVVQVADELPELRARLEQRLETVRERIVDPTATPGADCRQCRYVWRCPAHPGGVNVSVRRGDIRPGVIRLTPTSLDAWTRCGRAWRDQYLLAIPGSDDSGSPDHGQLVHDLLRFLHEQGSCHDPAQVEEVLDAHGADARLREEIANHERKCPMLAETVGHELELARFHGKPWPPFMATARVDAVWAHDGVLDARDYKTGNVWHQRVADDPRAAVQLFVLAPLARERGLRLRLRYEHLAAGIDDDPEPWEPDEGELEAVDERLRAIVETMRAEETWQGVSDESVCRHCRYRSICPDSASKTEPRWPAVGLVDDAGIDEL